MFPSRPSALPAPSVAQTGEEWMRRAGARHLERLAGVNDVTIVQVMEGGVLRARRTRLLRWYWSRSRPTAMVIGS